jgi:hypothetical protein
MIWTQPPASGASILYAHVPKAAGSSIQDFLDEKFSPYGYEMERSLGNIDQRSAPKVFLSHAVWHQYMYG